MIELGGVLAVHVLAVPERREGISRARLVVAFGIGFRVALLICGAPVPAVALILGGRNRRR